MTVGKPPPAKRKEDSSYEEESSEDEKPVAKVLLGKDDYQYELTGERHTDAGWYNRSSIHGINCVVRRNRKEEVPWILRPRILVEKVGLDTYQKNGSQFN